MSKKILSVLSQNSQCCNYERKDPEEINEILKNNILSEFELYEQLEEKGHKCACGEDIKNVFIIKNKINDFCIDIGCVCIDKLNFEPYNNIISDIKSKRTNKKYHVCKMTGCNKIYDNKKEHLKLFHVKQYYIVKVEEYENKLNVLRFKKLNFGKYKGREYNYIFDIDRNYLIWLINNAENAKLAAEIKQYIILEQQIIKLYNKLDQL